MKRYREAVAGTRMSGTFFLIPILAVMVVFTAVNSLAIDRRSNPPMWCPRRYLRYGKQHLAVLFLYAQFTNRHINSPDFYKTALFTPATGLAKSA